MTTMSTSSSSQSLKIGIVGFGNFGQFLAKTMIKQGHTLTATSRSDYSQLCLQMGIHFFRDVSAFLAADIDVIVLCTSILSLSEVVGSMPLTSLKRPTLFVDVLSVKEHPRELLLRELPEDSDILCTHPMFGPQTANNGWADHTFMYDKVRIRDEATCSSFIQIFATEGCKMVQMSCEEHDRAAAKSQFITHTIGRTLGEMDIQSTPIDTKGFETLVKLKETMMRNSFDLYSGLFVYNRFARQELENLEHAFYKVKETLMIQRSNGEQGHKRTES
ncbi:arogenate dehydrogenase 1, chloroplastic-like [Glycine soja]|uniref:Arogenate dehydrogenase 1, chloroplastic n=1 Tax=Glycine soja TaxID=3848 RepID=A0A0B2PB31_GLYSO|nr:arogenate dehydrogenase 1, chloroplastic-like [Glycine soja]KHN04797.1 Arogenate dehydrogenase 1, chloroplastic [Glycine soja]RZB73056.1 Arogenate dehydrogenase 1, chloroplastic [Glycine soja]